MNTAAAPSVLTRFTEIILKIRQAVAERGDPPLSLRGGPIPPIRQFIVVAVWHRLSRAQTLFRALAERYRAGTLRSFKRQPRTHPTPSTKPRTLKPEPALKERLPRSFAWLLALVPSEGPARANHLRLLLAEPEMQEILAASPRASRILGPTCRMLGIERDLLTPATGMPLHAESGPPPNPTSPDQPVEIESAPTAPRNAAGQSTRPPAATDAPQTHHQPGDPPRARLRVPW